MVKLTKFVRYRAVPSLKKATASRSGRGPSVSDEWTKKYLKNNILQLLQKHQSLTRTQLVRALGSNYSKAYIDAALSELVLEGKMIGDTNRDTGGRGRPVITYTIRWSN
jgi:hypothetical protein